MAEKADVRHTLNEQQARQLATVTKTVPMMQAITPRWLVNFLQWVPVEAGTYRVNKVVPTRPGSRTIECSPDDDVDLPEIYVDYEEKPREYTLSAVASRSFGNESVISEYAAGDSAASPIPTPTR